MAPRAAAASCLSAHVFAFSPGPTKVLKAFHSRRAAQTGPRQFISLAILAAIRGASSRPDSLACAIARAASRCSPRSVALVRIVRGASKFRKGFQHNEPPRVSYVFLNKHRNGKTNPDSYWPRSAAHVIHRGIVNCHLPMIGCWGFLILDFVRNATLVSNNGVNVDTYRNWSDLCQSSGSLAKFAAIRR